MRCNHCGYVNQPGARVCGKCGAPLGVNNNRRPGPQDAPTVMGWGPGGGMETEYCPYCGTPIMEGASFCANCGHAIAGPEFVNVDEPYYPPEVDPPYKNEQQMMRPLLIGVAIGVAVLMLVFGSIYAFTHWGGENGGNGESTDPTVATTTEQTEPETRETTERETTATQYVPRSNSPYSMYRDYELYDYSTPVFFEDSWERYLTEDDVYGMTEDQLQKAINDIYARNGKIFQTDEIQNYYYYQEWYSPISKKDDEVREYMNQYEIKNIDFLKKHQ